MKLDYIPRSLSNILTSIGSSYHLILTWIVIIYNYNDYILMLISYFRAAKLTDGYWTNPYFDCKGKVKKWLITYAVPFFGWDSLKVKLEFK